MKDLDTIIKICEKKEYFKRFKKDNNKYSLRIKIEHDLINKYLYIDNWNNFIDIYIKIKKIKYDIEIYEILGNKCKFYIDINKHEKVNTEYIKEKIKNIFIYVLNIQVNVLIYEDENIYRMIVSNYILKIEDCEYIYFEITKNIDKKIKKNIYSNKFSKWNFISIKNNEDKIDNNMFITNTENTIFIEISKNIINKKTLFNDNIIEGWIYIIKEREFIKTNESIYKIGCTNNIIRRYKQYPKYFKIIYVIINSDYKCIEKNVN